jgi:hypothetical protein
LFFANVLLINFDLNTISKHVWTYKTMVIHSGSGRDLQGSFSISDSSYEQYKIQLISNFKLLDTTAFIFKVSTHSKVSGTWSDVIFSDRPTQSIFDTIKLSEGVHCKYLTAGWSYSYYPDSINNENFTFNVAMGDTVTYNNKPYSSYNTCIYYPGALQRFRVSGTSIVGIGAIVGASGPETSSSYGPGYNSSSARNLYFMLTNFQNDSNTQGIKSAQSQSQKVRTSIIGGGYYDILGRMHLLKNSTSLILDRNGKCLVMKNKHQQN